MKKIIFIIPLLIFLFLYDSSSFAQQSSSLPGTTFPIAELNNCAGPKECRDFCNQESNRDACTRFAKKYGLSRQDQTQSQRKDAMLQKAKDELDCNSQESCSQICEQNQSKCEEFARRHGYYNEGSRTKEYQEKQKELVEKARSELDCNTQESCNSYCQQEQNRERCKEFARRHGYYNEGSRTKEYQEQQKTQPRIIISPQPTSSPCNHPESCPKNYEEQQKTTTSPQSTGSGLYTTPLRITTPTPTDTNREQVRGAATENPYDFHFQYVIEIQNLLN